VPTTSTRGGRRRGAQRHATALLSAAAFGLGLAACTDGSEESQGAPSSEPPAPSPTSSPGAGAPDAPTDSPTPTDSPAPTDDEALLDGTREVDVLTYADLWVTTTVEGGLTTVPDREESELPTTWVIEPATGDDDRYLLRSTATADDRDLCLDAPGDGVLGLAECDGASPTQHLDIGTTDRADEVNISTADGYLLADPDGGLELAPDAASPGTVFSLVDQGPA
jgi:hypothetical protein